MREEGPHNEAWKKQIRILLTAFSKLDQKTSPLVRAILKVFFVYVPA